MRIPVIICLMAALVLVLSCGSDAPPGSGGEASSLVQPSAWWENLPRPVYSTLERAPVRR